MDLRRVVGWILVGLGGSGLAFALAALFVSSRGVSLVMLPSLVLGLLVFLALPLAFLLVGWRLSHPRALAEAIRPRAVTPVSVVPEAEAAALRIPIDACPDCGYLGIRMPTIHDGLWPGGGETGARMVCPRCDWQGLPASFVTPESYAEFTRELNARRSGGASA